MQKIWVCGARGQIGQAVNDVVDKLEFEMLLLSILPKSELKRIKPELIEKYWPKKDEQK